jgi:hypothetical protein
MNSWTQTFAPVLLIILATVGMGLAILTIMDNNVRELRTIVENNVAALREADEKNVAALREADEKNVAALREADEKNAERHEQAMAALTARHFDTTDALAKALYRNNARIIVLENSVALSDADNDTLQ